MLCPRLRNNSIITLSWVNRDFVFCLVNMTYNPAGPQGIIKFISPIVSNLCCACEIDIAWKFKNSSDVPIKLVEGKELSEAGEPVEIALDATFNPNTLFPLFVRTVTNSYQTISKNTRKTRKNFEKLEITLKTNTFR